MKYLPILTGLITACAFGNIQKVETLTEAKTLIEKTDTNHWVFFDIDYTLTQPSEPILQMGTIKQNKDRFMKELKKAKGMRSDMLPLMMATYSGRELTEPMIPTWIESLQKEGRTVLGLTAMDTASIPQVGSVPAWRKKELTDLGIHFKSDYQPITFTEFAPFRDTYPIYEHGVIYCNVTAEKGLVALSFLEKTSASPKGIILIDDSPKNLESMETALKEVGIPFLGIHYKVAPQKELIPTENWDTVWEAIHKQLEEYPSESPASPQL